MGKDWSHTPEAIEKIRQSKLKLYEEHSKIVKCRRCVKEYKIALNRFLNGRGKYCSQECRYEDKKGIRVAVNTEFKKGQKPWNSGIKLSEEQVERMRGRIGLSEDKSPHWVGDRITYQGIHTWLRNKYGKPSYCEMCLTTNAKKFHWAKREEALYERKRENFIRLCASCHSRYDKIGEKVWIKRRGI